MAKESSRTADKDERTVDLVDESQQPNAINTSDSVAHTTAEVKQNSSDSGFSGRKVRVTFFESEGDLGKEPIYAGVNNYNALIPRGKPVEIPEEVFEMLSNLKYTIYTSEKGGGSSERVINRYNYHLHGPVDTKAAA